MHHTGTNHFYLAVIVFLPFVSENRADDVASVLDHHLSSLDVPLAEKTTTLYGGSVTEIRNCTNYFAFLTFMFISYFLLALCSLLSDFTQLVFMLRYPASLGHYL